MEKIIKKLVEEKISFEIPCYVKYGDAIFYKIVSKDKVLRINDFSFSKEISFQDFAQISPFNNEGWEFTNEDKFNEIFTKVFSELEELLPKTII